MEGTVEIRRTGKCCQPVASTACNCEGKLLGAEGVESCIDSVIGVKEAG